jgi:hypothetical protein
VQQARFVRKRQRAEREGERERVGERDESILDRVCDMDQLVSLGMGWDVWTRWTYCLGGLLYGVVWTPGGKGKGSFADLARAGGCVPVYLCSHSSVSSDGVVTE